LSVPGGTTPEAFLRALAKVQLDWAAVTVILNDERWVPADHERSNERLLRQTLLTGLAAAASYVPLYCETDTPEDGLPLLQDAVRAALPIDVLVLGMGADMHTASLFPGADRLTEALDPEGNALLLPMRAPGAAEARITMTLPALLTAGKTHILITGEDKQAALHTALEHGPVEDAPVRAILHSAAPTIHHAP
jgi:6-phosphogluconolactonase